MSGPLAGITVLEMANVISGPYAGMLLADLGAEVIKVEMPGTGDVFRLWDGKPGRVRSYFAAYNRGKQSITLDAKHPEGPSVFKRLAEHADVVLENFRPGTLDRLGMGYEDIRAVNPRIIYCSITGMGSEGPMRDRPTYDAIAQAISGLWSQFIDMDHPEPLGPPMCDQLTGLYAAYGILGALVRRGITGEGQRLEVSMLGAAMAFQPVPIADYTMDGKMSDKMSRPRRSQSYAFVAQDGLPLAIHLSTPQKFWKGLADALGHPELASDPRYADKSDRIRRYDELAQVLGEIFATKPRQYWLEALAAHDVPAAPINTVAEAIQEPQVAAMNLIRSFGQGDRTYPLVGFPVAYAGSPCEPSLPPPEIGEHTAAILERVGYTPDAIARLRQAMVL